MDNVNDSNDPSIERALCAYFQFIVIHPFNDGNGRLSRVLLDVLLNRGIKTLNQSALLCIV
ncbi:MAG: Fic family protein [Algicola sp.]|nr:Fic family protein [Algicola sp.]